MKLVAFHSALMVISFLVLTSCGELPDEMSRSFKLGYSFGPDDTMYILTKSSPSEVFEEFYSKMTTGELVADTYSLTFTNLLSGEEYYFSGSWSNATVELPIGSYAVRGKSTAVGEQTQEKCSLYFNESISITSEMTTIMLTAHYDCFLFVLTSDTIASVDKCFQFNNKYWYAFVNGDSLETLTGVHQDGSSFSIDMRNYSLEKGKYYVYSDVTSNAYNTGYTLERMENGEDTINLSAEGTANCYIINNAGTYIFNGSVKGNSLESVGEPVYAAVIWETFNSATAPSVGDVISDVSFSNGFVQFSSTGSKGNALIAVKDIENKILWSWHIWVTDYNPNSDYDTYNGHQSVKMMDRNLGAMSSEPGLNSIGLIYEWGRKDPFMGSTSLTSYSQFASTVSFPNCITSTTTIGTEQFAAENPMQYIIANAQNKDWLYSSNNSAWSSGKSKNDPCPKGWKVPDGGQNSVWSSFPSAITTSSGVIWNSTYKGLNVSESLASSPVWYPAQGYHGDSDTYYSGYWQVGAEGRYWTTHTLGNGSDYFQFKSSTIETYHTTTSTHFSRANGLPVRCCSE